MAKLSLKSIWMLLKESYLGWDNDKAWRLGAALAYFTVFSLAPFLLIVIALAGLIFGQDAAQGQIVNQIQGLIGTQGAQTVQAMLENAYLSRASIPVTIFGVIMLVFGATGVFVQLRDALNTVWHIDPKPVSTVRGFVKTRLTSLSIIMGIGFILLVSLIISAALGAVSGYLGRLLPGLDTLLKILDFLISFVVITILFAMIFKVLPDAQASWRDVMIGAAVTSLLFSIGKTAIGLYLGNSGVASTFGAASSLVIILLWTFYSTQIMLFGAEFTKVYANRFGSRIAPEPGAQQIDIKKVPAESSRRGVS